MSMLGLDGNTIDTLITQYRIEAEKSIAPINAALSSQKDQLAQVVAAFRTALFDALTRAIHLHTRVIEALARDPQNAALQGAQARLVQVITKGTALAQGYAAYERPADQGEASQAVQVGVAPAVVLVVAIVGVAVVALSITGVCWAVVHYEQAKTLQREIELVAQDPAVAPLLTRLNESQPAGGDPKGGGMGAGVAVALGLLAVGGGAIWWLNRGAR